MYTAIGYAAQSATTPLAPMSFERRSPRADDVAIEILYCGVCHSDIHQARNEWGIAVYPLMPGHEIVGKVTAVGASVSAHKVGDLVGVGCMVDSCRTCDACKSDLEQYCLEGPTMTYATPDRVDGSNTMGGYSDSIVVSEHFVVKIPARLDLASAAPILCAGVTMYSPIKHYGIKAGDKVGVLGMGGLGHMGIKLAKAIGAEVTLFTRSASKADGALYSVKPVNLLAGLLNALQRRTELDTSQVDDIVLGCVTPVGDQGADIAKTAALVADWDISVAGVQINRFCASGLEAVNLGAMKVRSGFEDLVVVGGVESMSRVPMGSDGGAWVLDPQTNLHSHFTPQGIGADLIATLEGFSRQDVDTFALQSQQKAARARADGAFDKSLVPVRDQNGILLLEQDEFIRGDSTLEGLGKLKPSFEMMGQMGFDATALRVYSHVERINHVHTPGNSSGIVDGAALMLIGSEAKGRDLGLTPRARIVATAVTSTDPTIMLTGPAPATRKALAKAGLRIEDIDLFEVNEAFASVVLKFIKDMAIDPAKVNVNGGSIAMGHPLGATGCAILGTLLDELEARHQRYGLATLCVGGGMGIATIIERL